ncbi:gluconokinase [Arthrobacter cupressi]|uniref:Gluconokinase n=1 Tax=Arthrobacter cupressi TaxID=1045773 RepID=A0A1G8W2B6_9MICC|nr:gluconokinase [Arthrobacter cupressi]NYD78549.1 gluconokinase [Arthrobacter cupressi]SDJ71865.1 gluconokinase [Arthrobacter cupressi]
MESSAIHVVVMGVAGAGKSTIAGALSSALGWDMAEADRFHTAANISKMAGGVPLTDEDRWPWLRSIRDWMSSEAAAGNSTVLTCSALKRSYRNLLAEAEGRVVFVHLDGSPELLAERMGARAGHFMPTTLLPSQLATLEPLSAEELAAGSVRLDIVRDPDTLVAAVVGSLALQGA